MGFSFGTVVKKNSGPVSSLDSNGAEVYALLVGCCELRMLGGYNTIFGGGSFSAIQWCLGKSPFPWRLADLVEEVQDILSQLRASFNHILCEANNMADGLAWEGVFWLHILFDF